MIGPEHWSLWAIESREGTGNLGYPHEVPFYQPARRSDSNDGSYYFTTKDHEISTHIGVAVHRLNDRDSTLGRALREFYGAYPGASELKKDRIQSLRRFTRMGNHRSMILVDRGRQWVEGWVESKYG